MAGRTLYISIAVVMTCFPIQVQTVTCINNNSVSVDGECYIKDSKRFKWAEAIDKCKNWNGTLPTFTSIDQLGRVFMALGIDGYTVWVGAQSETQKLGGYQWAAAFEESRTQISVYSGDCKSLLFLVLCKEINNNMSTNNSTIITITPTTTNVDFNTSGTSLPAMQKEACLYSDSIPVDGKCFRPYTEKLFVSEAETYCKNWNQTMATISSVDQGIKLLTKTKLNNQDIFWVTDSVNSNRGEIISLERVDGCEVYNHTLVMVSTKKLPVVCIELPITTAVYSESTVAHVPTTTQTLNTTQLLNIRTKTTPKPELTTALESTTDQLFTSRRESTSGPAITTAQDSTTEQVSNTTQALNTTQLLTIRTKTTPKPELTTALESTTDQLFASRRESTSGPAITTAQDSTTEQVSNTTQALTTTQLLNSTPETPRQQDQNKLLNLNRLLQMSQILYLNQLRYPKSLTQYGPQLNQHVNRQTLQRKIDRKRLQQQNRLMTFLALMGLDF